ncbi:MAG: SUF system Fe-S cluster assembly regulator [Alphaproteobacteria bacterium]
MFRVSKMTDYAIVVLGELSRSRDSRMTVASLATATGLTEPTIGKVLKLLARTDMVDSQRGVGGGYLLGRAPDDITIGDIITALEGPIAITACVDGSDDHCTIEGLCGMRGNWERVNTAIRDALGSVTLGQMMTPGYDFMSDTGPDAQGGTPDQTTRQTESATS